MNDLRFESLGATWVNLVYRTVRQGTRMGEEGYEWRGVSVGFPASQESDPILDRFADRTLTAEMDRVFFVDGPNSLGHSYARLMRGPEGRPDLEDVTALLRANPWSKRAVVTLCGEGGGRVPCINVIQFLVREGAVQATYYARGQDAFRKFYADGLCLAALGRRVATALALAPGLVTGFIASSHVYFHDLPAVESLLAKTRESLRHSPETGGD